MIDHSTWGSATADLEVHQMPHDLGTQNAMLRTFQSSVKSEVHRSSLCLLKHGGRTRIDENKVDWLWTFEPWRWS